MDLRYKGDGNLVPYLGKNNRRWKTAFDSGLILKNNVYYIENIIEPIEHMANDANAKVYGINVYQINGKYKKYLFSMNKNKIDKYFKPMTQESFSKSMKLIIETYGGRKIQKRFTKLKEAKEYVLRNKAFIKEAQIVNEELTSWDKQMLAAGGGTLALGLGLLLSICYHVDDKPKMDSKSWTEIARKCEVTDIKVNDKYVEYKCNVDLDETGHIVKGAGNKKEKKSKNPDSYINYGYHNKVHGINNYGYGYGSLYPIYGTDSISQYKVIIGYNETDNNIEPTSIKIIPNEKYGNDNVKEFENISKNGKLHNLLQNILKKGLHIFCK